MTSESIETEIKEIKNRQDFIVHQREEIKEYLKKIEEKSVIVLKPMQGVGNDYHQFLEREKWISRQKSKYINELIAYIDEDGGWKVIAHSPVEKELFLQIDQLIQSGEISENTIITFR